MFTTEYYRALCSHYRPLPGKSGFADEGVDINQVRSEHVPDNWLMDWSSENLWDKIRKTLLHCDQPTLYPTVICERLALSRGGSMEIDTYHDSHQYLCLRRSRSGSSRLGAVFTGNDPRLAPNSMHDRNLKTGEDEQPSLLPLEGWGKGEALCAVDSDVMTRTLASVIALGNAGLVLADRVIAGCVKDVNWIESLIIIKILAALEVLRENGLRPGNINSQNVLLNSDGVLKLSREPVSRVANINFGHRGNLPKSLCKPPVGLVPPIRSDVPRSLGDAAWLSPTARLSAKHVNVQLWLNY
ncbi:hypothetical protein C8F04DRAFT_1318319 [Mycena alexandri]|uniref:Uncharacterized protein n=1 Tax=Mycena alexandri TaxID=1745969 RepID=A0AAD6S768_9AGAR|nr:hypothetical protein C8F04DRAFT_1318319 [Mycena alexandri]